MAEKRENETQIETKNSSSKLIKNEKTQKTINKFEKFQNEKSKSSKSVEKCPKTKSKSKTEKSSVEEMKKSGSNWLQVSSITLNLFLIVSFLCKNGYFRVKNIIFVFDNFWPVNTVNTENRSIPVKNSMKLGREISSKKTFCPKMKTKMT